MKLRFFTFLFLSAICITSCRKDNTNLTIKQYDQQQILNYIQVHGLTGMVPDPTGGDTSGMYYQILQQGSGPALQYTDKVSFVFSLRSFDGTYQALDTINNHFDDYVGHINNPDRLPIGLQTAIVTLLKYKGASMRLLIPSHLAYGRNGYGSGSSQLLNNKIPGNACLDYYVHVISNQAAYDDQVIQNYMAANNLTGYKRTADGLWYNVLTPGTNVNDPITANSTVTCTYTGQILNGTLFDYTHNGSNTASFPVGTLTTGVMEGLVNYATAGTKISLLIPSALGYGETAQSGIPVNSCLRFTFQIITVSP